MRFPHALVSFLPGFARQKANGWQETGAGHACIPLCVSAPLRAKTFLAAEVGPSQGNGLNKDHMR